MSAPSTHDSTVECTVTVHFGSQPVTSSKKELAFDAKTYLLPLNALQIPVYVLKKGKPIPHRSCSKH